MKVATTMKSASASPMGKRGRLEGVAVLGRAGAGSNGENPPPYVGGYGIINAVASLWSGLFESERRSLVRLCSPFYGGGREKWQWLRGSNPNLVWSDPIAFFRLFSPFGGEVFLLEKRRRISGAGRGIQNRGKSGLEMFRWSAFARLSPAKSVKVRLLAGKFFVGCCAPSHMRDGTGIAGFGLRGDNRKANSSLYKGMAKGLQAYSRLFKRNQAYSRLFEKNF